MYKTKSLDTAAYIYSQGHDCDVKPLQASYAEFSFKGTEAKRLSEKFRRGEVVMNVKRYNHARTELKHLGSKALSYEINKGKPCTV